jgi:hypothetical protein
MLVRTPLRIAILLAAASAGSRVWGQTPLRKPDTQSPAAVQPRDSRTVAPRANRGEARRESVRGNARSAQAAVDLSPQATSACGSAVTVSSPSTDPPIFPNTGGTANLNVFAPSGCQWKASGSAAWLTPKSGSAATVYSGQQTIPFTVAASIVPAPQTGQMVVTDAVTGSQLAAHTIAQLPARVGAGQGVILNFASPQSSSYCNSPQATPQVSVNLNTTPVTIAQSQQASATSGQFAAGFANETPSGQRCGWTVLSVSDRWLAGPAPNSHLYTGADSNATLAVPYSVDSNQGAGQSAAPPRSGTIVLVPPGTIPGDTLTGPNVSYIALQVNQTGGVAPCNNYSLSPPTIGALSGGGSQLVSIVAGGAGSSCAWQLQTSNPDWITNVQSQSGTGDQNNFTFTVLPNSSTSSRTGTISIQGQPQAGQVTVTQPGVVCTPQVSSPGQSFSSSGGTGSFQLTIPAACQWSATSTNSGWLHITSGGQGPGPGTVSFTADPNNSTSSQSATISILNAPVFTVTESPASCSYALSGNSTSVASSGTSGSFQVTTQPSTGCSWTAISQQNWISTTSSGQSSGTVNFTVAANASTNSRTGAISVADQTFNITQAGLSCNYTLSLTTINATATAASYPLQVSTPNGCSWTAQSSVSWITLDTTSGSATATINVNVSANGSTSSRTGTVSVGPQGQVLTVNQPAGGQNNPPTATFTASPNPIPACGSQTTGTTTFTWNASGVSGVNLYAGSATGTLLYSGPASGSYSSSSITNGEVVVLTDTSQNVLGQVTLYLNFSCGATLVQAVVTDQSDFSSAICAVPNAKSTFDYHNAFATLWFSMQNVPAGSTILAEFLDPYGNVDLNQTFKVTATTQQYCNASVGGVFYDYQDGFVPATLPGGWTARLSLNGSVLGTFPYYINGPLTYNWTFTANSDVDDISQPPYTADTKTFSTNDAGMYTYFSTNNSQTGDVNRLYYFRWDATNQAWVSLSESDYDPLTSGGIWYFSDELQISGNSAVQQNPGFFAVVATVTQQGGVETPTFQEIFAVSQPAQLQASPSSLTFATTVGGASPAAQTVPITSAPSGVAVAAAIANGSPWLSAQLSATSTPANLVVSVNSAGLAVGVYSDSVTLTTPGSSLTIPVKLSITALGTVLTSISPTSIVALSGATTLQVSGQNFTLDAHVHWNGPGGASADLQTQYQSATALQATIPASLLTTPGAAQVSITNSQGSSAQLPFQITTPTPHISSLSPNSAPVGNAQLTLTVSGSNFVNGAQIYWTAPGGATNALQTQFVSSTSLKATVPASYLTVPGQASVSVSNSGMVSGPSSFQITGSSLTVTNAEVIAAPATDSTGANNFCLTPTAQTAFRTSDSVVWVWFTTASGNLGDSLQVSWIDPTGRSYTAQPSILNYSGGGCYGNYLSISGYSPASTPGNWQVQIIANGKLAVTLPFTIAGTFTVTAKETTAGLVSDSSGNLNFCATPVNKTAFLESDSAVWLWFTIANARSGDVFQVDFVDPLGRGNTATPVTINYSGSGCYGYYIPIAGYPPASDPGTWHAQLLVNNAAAFSLPFTISR